MARADAPKAGATGLCHAAQAPRKNSDPEKLCLEIPDLREQSQTRKVTDALSGVKGVSATVVDLNTRLAVVDYDPNVTGLDQFVAACRDAGFAASEYLVEKRFPKPIKLKGG
jgi:copper chaperone CopZ